MGRAMSINEEGLEDLIGDIERVYDKFAKDKNFKTGVHGYNLFNTYINMHVSTHSGYWNLNFSKTIFFDRKEKRKMKLMKSLSIEEALEELPYNAVSLLLMNTFVFGGG